MDVGEISNPFFHREKKRVAFLFTSEDFQVVDLDMTEEKARELHKKLEDVLKEFNN